MTKLSVSLDRGRHLRVAVEGCVLYFDPASENAKHRYADADAVFVTGVDAALATWKPDGRRWPAFEREEGLRDVLGAGTQVYAAGAFRAYFQQRLAEAKAGTLEKPQPAGFYLGLEGRVHKLDARKSLALGPCEATYVELGATSDGVAHDGIVLALGAARVLVAHDALADGVRTSLPAVDLLVTYLPRAALVDAPGMVSLLQGVPAKAVFPCHYMGKAKALRDVEATVAARTGVQLFARRSLDLDL
jgi:hypothetical protein